MKAWSKQEEEYLIEKWGSVSVKTIARKLRRSENAVIVRKNKLGLGAFLKNGEYITWNQLHIALGIGISDSYKMISWVRNRDFPLHTKRVNNSSFKIVYLEEWWEWAEKNRNLLDFSRFEENMLGKEPQWAKDKRRHDVEKTKKYIITPWTKTEDNRLAFLVAKHKYTYDDLSRMMRRTNGAIQRRLCYLGIKDRPVKAYNHTRWTEEEFNRLGELIKVGYGYDLMAERIGKSSKAIRGRVYQMYLTENLDKVRQIIGDGCFGDNRLERTLRSS